MSHRGRGVKAKCSVTPKVVKVQNHIDFKVMSKSKCEKVQGTKLSIFGVTYYFNDPKVADNT